MAYSGKRCPRDGDLEKWKVFFEVNPGRSEEFPEWFKKINVKTETTKTREIRTPIIEKKDEEEIITPKKKTKPKTKKEQGYLSKLDGMMCWSPLLGACVTITDVDEKFGTAKLHISKTAIVNIDDLLALNLEGYSNINIRNKQFYLDSLNKWEAKNIEAFRKFKDFLFDYKEEKESVKDIIEETIK